MKYPKILIISSIIPQNRSAGNILLYRLLQNYPAEKILVIGHESTRWKDEDLLKGVKYCRLESRVFKLGFTRFSKLVRTVQIFLPFYKTINKIRKQTKEFNPDIILSVMESYSYYYPAFKYAKSKKIPFSLIIHDQPEEFEPVYQPFQKMQLRKNATIYNSTISKMNISKQMELFLRSHYGTKGDVLYPLPSIYLKPRMNIENKSLRNINSLTIGYAGTPAYGYGFQLEEMIPVLEKLNSKIRFYGSSLPTNLKNCKNIEYGGFDSPERTWDKVKEECDSVILPYTWIEGTYKKLYETHFPSKLPEYLSLGMPVIVIGPKYATGVIWAMENHNDVVSISERNQEEWYTKLKKLIIDAEYRVALGKNSLIKRDHFFEPKLIQEQFLNYINRI